jgi:hypothetical protein
MMRLEEDKLEALRRWGRALRESGAEESAAAGRAILMLIEEIERLQLKLSCTPEESTRDDLAIGLASTLRGRLSPTASQGATTSPEAWIESLRRKE